MATKTALIVIDIQNDYFPGGLFPLWEPEVALQNTLQAIKNAQAEKIPVLLVQHVCDPSSPAPFFNAGSEGVAIHREILAAAPNAPVFVKQHADCFIGTELQAYLEQHGISELILTGMMTHNCVAFTAVSPAASKYNIEILSDCCTSVSQMVHLIALNALGDRVVVRQSGH